METVRDMRSFGSNPVSCSETSIKIYGSKEEIRARKSPETVDAPGFAPDASIPVTLYGAEGGIRTLARFNPTTPLAGEPLIATWVLLHGYNRHHISASDEKVAERVGFEPTALDESPVFKTGSLNHSDISPHLFQSEANKIIPHRTPFVNPPEPAFRKTIVFLLQVLQRRSFRHPLLAFDHTFGIQIADLSK